MDRKHINDQWAQVARKDWGDSIAGFVVWGLIVAKIIPSGQRDIATQTISTALDSFVAAHGAMPMCDTQESQNTADDQWSKEVASFVVDALVNKNLISPTSVAWATSISAEEVFVWITMEARPRAFYSSSSEES